MYTEILKQKYKKPSAEFWAMVENFLYQMDAAHSDYKMIADAFNRHRNFQGIPMRTFWDVRNAIGAFRDHKRTEYFCSPQSETYWAS